MKAWKIVAAVVAVLVIGVVVFALTFDIGKYKGLIQEQAKAATGREVTIGDIRLAVSLTPAVVLQDVVVANAPWGSRPQMLIVKRIEVKMELMPLLSGNVVITKVGMDDADILLETNKQGKANWDFEGEAKPEAGAKDKAAPPPPIAIGAIDGSALKVTLKDGKTGGETDVALKSLSLRISGPAQDLNISEVRMADLNVSRKEGQDDIQATVGKVSMDASGKITDLGIRQLDVSDIKVSGKTAGGPLNLVVSKFSLDEKGMLDLQATYNAEEIRAKGSVGLVAALKSGKKALPAKLSLEGFGLKGDVDLTVDAASTPPSVKGSVSIPEIDVAKFTAPAAKSSAPAAPVKTAPAAVAPAASAHMIPDAPLPWALLSLAEADVKLSIGTVKLANGQKIENVVLPIALDHGRLAIKGASIDVAGGKVGADIDANANDKTVAVKGSLKGMTAEALAQTYKITDLISKGPLDLAVDVRGSGVSPHAIASTLSGSVIGGMGESRIRNEALNFIGADVLMQILSAVNPMGNKDPYTVARCAVVNLQISGGIANTQNGIALVTDKMNVVGTGKLDLGQERVDMVVKPTATGGLGIGLGKLVSAVKVSGPMAKPNIGLDAGGTAKALGSLGAAFATGGASLLAQGASDRAGAAGAGDPCQIARTWTVKK